MKKIQNKIKEFCKQNNLENAIETRVLDTVSELGEVAKEVLKMSNYGKEKPKYKEELGDLFYSVITIANTYDIDLEDALNQAIEKYKRRLTKGSAGSENN